MNANPEQSSAGLDAKKFQQQYDVRQGNRVDHALTPEINSNAAQTNAVPDTAHGDAARSQAPLFLRSSPAGTMFCLAVALKIGYPSSR